MRLHSDWGFLEKGTRNSRVASRTCQVPVNVVFQVVVGFDAAKIPAEGELAIWRSRSGVMEDSA